MTSQYIIASFCHALVELINDKFTAIHVTPFLLIIEFGWRQPRTKITKSYVIVFNGMHCCWSNTYTITHTCTSHSSCTYVIHWFHEQFFLRLINFLEWPIFFISVIVSCLKLSRSILNPAKQLKWLHVNKQIHQN